MQSWMHCPLVQLAAQQRMVEQSMSNWQSNDSRMQRFASAHEPQALHVPVSHALLGPPLDDELAAVTKVPLLDAAVGKPLVLDEVGKPLVLLLLALGKPLVPPLDDAVGKPLVPLLDETTAKLPLDARDELEPEPPCPPKPMSVSEEPWAQAMGTLTATRIGRSASSGRSEAKRDGMDPPGPRRGEPRPMSARRVPVGLPRRVEARARCCHKHRTEA
jgi:hypothetical protein